MAKAKLTTRAISSTTVTSDNLAKSSQLTHSQLDSNFLNLRDATFSVVADDSATIQIGMDSNLYIQGGDNVTTSTDSAGVVTINATSDVTASSSTTFTNKTIDVDNNTVSNIEVDNLKSGVLDTDISSVAGTDTTLASAKAIKAYVDSKSHTALSGSTNNTLTTVTGANAIQGESNLQFDGSTLAVTGAGTFSTTLGVTGASTLDQVTITDNTISTNASNANLEINANGSGTIVLENLSVAGDGATVTGILDEDAMGSDSAVKLATQQSIKAYVDSVTPSGIGDLSVIGSTIISPSNADITLEPSGTGAIVMPAITINDNNISATRSQDNLMLSSSGSGNIILDGYKVQIGDDDSTGPNPWRYYTDTNPPTIRTPNTNDDLVFETVSSDNSVGGNFIFLTGTSSECRLALRNNGATGGTHYIGAANINGETIICNGIAYENNIDRPNLFNVGWYSSKIVVHSGDGFSVTSADIDIDPLGGGEVNISGGGLNMNATPIKACSDLEVDGIQLVDNKITATRTNDNLYLQGAGSGGVKVFPGDTFSISPTNDFTNELQFFYDNTGNFSAKIYNNAVSGTQIRDGADQSSVNSRIGLLARRIFLGGVDTNVSLSASVGGGDFTIANGDNPSEGSITNHNSIVLTDSSDGEITINPKAGKWVQVDGVTITDNTISSNASNANLELSGNGSGIVDVQTGIKIGTGATVTTILDEDNMATDSATALATQQSIKAYVDAAGGGGGASTGDITFVGSTIISPSNADLTLNPAGTGKVNINAVYTLPNADGSANEVLGTNGSGVLSFRDPTAINIDGGVADSTYTSVPTIDGGTA